VSQAETETPEATLASLLSGLGKRAAEHRRSARTNLILILVASVLGVVGLLTVEPLRYLAAAQSARLAASSSEVGARSTVDFDAAIANAIDQLGMVKTDPERLALNIQLDALRLERKVQFDRSDQRFAQASEDAKPTWQSLASTLGTKLAILGALLFVAQVFGGLYRYNTMIATRAEALADALRIKLLAATTPSLTSAGLEILVPAVVTAPDDLFKGKQMIEAMVDVVGKAIEKIPTGKVGA
jgi:hypothetical protein